MAAGGIVVVPWYATLFRGDRFADALAEIAPYALRYGASRYEVRRSREDPYRFSQIAEFADKLSFEAYWNGPEFIDWRTRYSSWFQIPVLYEWQDVVAIGAIGNGNGVPAPVPEAEPAA